MLCSSVQPKLSTATQSGRLRFFQIHCKKHHAFISIFILSLVSLLRSWVFAWSTKYLEKIWIKYPTQNIDTSNPYSLFHVYTDIYGEWCFDLCLIFIFIVQIIRFPVTGIQDWLPGQTRPDHRLYKRGKRSVTLSDPSAYLSPMSTTTHTIHSVWSTSTHRHWLMIGWTVETDMVMFVEVGKAASRKTVRFETVFLRFLGYYHDFIDTWAFSGVSFFVHLQFFIIGIVLKYFYEFIFLN